MVERTNVDIIYNILSGKNQGKKFHKTMKKLNAQTKASQIAQKFDKAGFSIGKGNVMLDRFGKKLTGSQKQVKSWSKANTESVFSFSRAMGGLSLLFFFQKIRTSLVRFQTTAVSSFTKITKSQTETGQALTALRANFEFLKFTVGSAIATALGPLIPKLIQIATGVSNWVAQNPKITAWTLLIGAALAAVIAFAGEVILLIAGLKALFGVGLAGSALETGLATASTKVGLLAGSLALGGVVIGSGLAIVSFKGLLAAVKTEGIKDDIISSIGLLLGTALAGAGIAVLLGASVPAGAAIGLAIGVGIIFTVVSAKFGLPFQGLFDKAKTFLADTEIKQNLEQIFETKKLIEWGETINDTGQTFEEFSAADGGGILGAVIDNVKIFADALGGNNDALQDVEQSQQNIIDTDVEFINNTNTKATAVSNLADETERLNRAQNRTNRTATGRKNFSDYGGSNTTTG